MTHAQSVTSIDQIFVLNMRYNEGELQVVRSNMLSGGGACNVAIKQCNLGDTLGLNLYQGHTSAVSMKIRVSIMKLR